MLRFHEFLIFFENHEVMDLWSTITAGKNHEVMVLHKSITSWFSKKSKIRENTTSLSKSNKNIDLEPI